MLFPQNAAKTSLNCIVYVILNLTAVRVSVLMLSSESYFVDTICNLKFVKC